MKKRYEPLTAKEVSEVLAFADCDEMTGEELAERMLEGEERFTRAELKKIAEYAGLEVNELIRLDERFTRYIGEAERAKMEIAVKMIKANLGVEMAAELAGLPIEDVLWLKGVK